MPTCSKLRHVRGVPNNLALAFAREQVPMCVTDDGLEQQPDMLRLKICDEQRTNNTTK
jgi:hypothetical protein